MKATKLAFKGHSLPARISDHGFWLATIGVYHATGVPFPEVFFAVGDKSGHLCLIYPVPLYTEKGKPLALAGPSKRFMVTLKK